MDTKINGTDCSTDSHGPDSTDLDSNGNNLRKSLAGRSSAEAAAKSADKNEQVGAIDPNRPLPNSKKIYVSGKIHPEIKVPFREISLAPTKTMSGEIEVNEPVRVYDTSGPWGDSRFDGDVEKGLPSLRSDWIRARSDVEEITGRIPTPIDDGWLSEKHAAERNGGSRLSVNGCQVKRNPLRAKSGAVTQLAYARRGIVTPEMEYIAIRENLGRDEMRNAERESRNADNSSLVTTSLVTGAE